MFNLDLSLWKFNKKENNDPSPIPPALKKYVKKLAENISWTYDTDVKCPSVQKNLAWGSLKVGHRDMSDYILMS